MRFWYRYWNGYVEICLTGSSPERFFNLCGNAGLSIWNIVSDKSGVSFCMDLSSFLRCRPYARKSHVRLHVLRRRGVPFFLHRNRRRWMWGAGVLAFFGLLFFLSFFLWDIEYQGNQRYTDSQLDHTLERLGIRCGMRKDAISCEKLEEALREEYEDLTWVSAKVSGTRLYLSVKENEVLLHPEMPVETPCDLRAAADAVIRSVVVRSGIPAVKAGDVVKAGDLLVSGRISITDDSGTEIAAHSVHADADVIGCRERNYQKQISCWHEREIPVGTKRYGLAVRCGSVGFLWQAPDFRKKSWHTVATYLQAELWGDFVLPLSFGWICSEEVSVSSDFYRETELQNLAEAYQSGIMENLMEKGVHIIENNVRILVNGSVCQITVTLQTEEPIQFVAQQGEEQINEHN